jgi:hypothetical protein
MRLKEIIAVAGVLAVLSFAYSYASGARADAVAAEERVQMLKAERLELQLKVEEVVEGYNLLVDSLAQAHDSLAEVRAEAVEAASEASRSFERGFDVLRDSLGAYDGLVEILDQAREDRQEEVTAYQAQIQTLEADKVLLFKRVTALDSVWVLEQQVNKVLRTEIVALHEEADAWERLSNTNFLGGLRGVAPYALAGVGIVLILK